MNKVTSTALLGMLALANAGLDYSAVCVFLDVDPFGTFSPNNFFAGLVAVAQSLLLIILPWVASEKIAAGEKGPAACAIIGSLFVAMAGAFLRATTEAASTTTSVSGEVVSGLSIDGMAFVLIMAGIALGEAIAAFLIKSLDIRAEAEALQAEIQRMRIIEDHIDEDIATAARVALAAGRQSIATAKGSCEQVFQQLGAKSDDSHNCFIGFVDEIEAQRKAEREQFDKLSAEFDARIAKKFPGAIAAAQKAPTAEAAAANAAAAHGGSSEGGSVAADTNDAGHGTNTATNVDADTDSAGANPANDSTDFDAAAGASETAGDADAAAVPMGDPNTAPSAENPTSDQVKAA